MKNATPTTTHVKSSSSLSKATNFRHPHLKKIFLSFLCLIVWDTKISTSLYHILFNNQKTGCTPYSQFINTSNNANATQCKINDRCFRFWIVHIIVLIITTILHGSCTVLHVKIHMRLHTWTVWIIIVCC